MTAVNLLAVVVALLILVESPSPEQRRQMNETHAASPMRYQQVQKVVDEVEASCRRRYVYMIGPQKAKRLAQLVREKKPRLVVECGAAIGYSGLWMARELMNLEKGRLITIEIDGRRATEARENFSRAGLSRFVEVWQGDARSLVREIEGPVDFLFLDCNYQNYLPCFKGVEDRLEDGAIVVADNADAGASGMADYLTLVRGRYQSRTEWFDMDLPWGSRDAMEVTIFRKAPAVPKME